MKKSIVNEKETREHLLKIAKEEFLELGYEKASLRNICKKANMTTGAVYYFFQDKKDLFQQLIAEPLNIINQVIEEHFAEESAIYITKEVPKEVNRDYLADMQAGKDVVKVMYQYREEMRLLILIGPDKDQTIDSFINLLEKHLYNMILSIRGKEGIDEYLIHWISHVQVQSFIHVLSHIDDVETAEKEMEQIIKFQFGGWSVLFPEFFQ